MPKKRTPFGAIYKGFAPILAMLERKNDPLSSVDCPERHICIGQILAAQKDIADLKIENHRLNQIVSMQRGGPSQQ